MMKHLPGKSIALILLCILILTACGNSETEKYSITEPMDRQLFLLGLIPERNIFTQLERYNPLATYLSKKINRKVELKILPRYGNIIDNFVSSNLDAAFFGSFTYTLAHAKLGVEVLARPEALSGRSTYHGLIFVRRDSGINSAKEMKGKSIALVDKATTAGYLFPMAYLMKSGITDLKTFFNETYFTGTHEDAIYDVLNKKADIGAAKNTVYFDFASIDERISSELRILEKSFDVPENGIAVKKDMDPLLKDQIKQTLLNMHKYPEGMKILKNFGAKAFLETSDDDYGNVRLLCKEIGLDLKTYNYIND